MNPSFPIPAIIGLEAISSILIIVLCLLIFHKTKEMYQLTKDKGLLYFRYSFLFFALAYVFRFCLFFLRQSSIASVHDLPIITVALLFATGYSSTVAILYLTMSELWKIMGRFKPSYVVHGMAVIISILAFASKSQLLVAMVQLVLLMGIIVISILWKQVSKRKHLVITSIYVMLFLFWIANLLAWGPPGVPPISIRIALRVVSVAIFIVIFYKVFKWTR